MSSSPRNDYKRPRESSLDYNPHKRQRVETSPMPPQGGIGGSGGNGPNPNEVQVRNLPYETRREEFEDFFARFGDMVRVYFPTFRDSGRSKGFAYVTYSDATGMEAALASDGEDFIGRPLEVSVPKPKNAFTGRSLEIYVGNLPYESSEEDLRGFFEKCGEVVDTRLAVDFHTNRKKGYGFVEFATIDGVREALKYDGYDFQGRPLRINEEIKGERRGGNRRKRSSSYGNERGYRERGGGYGGPPPSRYRSPSPSYRRSQPSPRYEERRYDDRYGSPPPAPAYRSPARYEDNRRRDYSPDRAYGYSDRPRERRGDYSYRR